MPGLPISPPLRRVVTGLNADGRSCALFDDAVTPAGDGGSAVGLIWRTTEVPGRDTGGADMAAGGFAMEMMKGTGSNFLLFELRPEEGLVGPGMHATDTLDYIVVLRGPVELTLEEGRLTLGTGDCVVDRGVLHGWRAPGPESALLAVINLPSQPVGQGATI